MNRLCHLYTRTPVANGLLLYFVEKDVFGFNFNGHYMATSGWFYSASRGLIRVIDEIAAWLLRR